LSQIGFRIMLPAMNARKLHKLQREMQAFVEDVAAGIGRSERKQWCSTYLRGLLLDGDRKSIEPMASRLTAIDRPEKDYIQALQQFINQSNWEDPLIRENMRRRIGRTFGTEGVLIIDDTGFVKQGKHSVGVARQYSGTLGKVGNCQIAVTLQFQVDKSVLCIDAELYLPESWTTDGKRLKKAGVPQETGYRPKWQIALAMLRQARSEGFSGPVLADSAYGSVTQFRRELDTLGLPWCLGIDSTLRVIAADADLGPVPAKGSMGRTPTRPQKIADRTLKTRSAADWAWRRRSAFRTVTWRPGSQGPMSSRFAVWRVRHAYHATMGYQPLEACWLIAEWPLDAEKPTKYFFSNLPATASRKELVRLAKRRWWVEHSYKELKEELGLDHFEGRSWRGWHHHVTLTMLAYLFLVELRSKLGKRGIPA
jgi:SRSO17 transposase